MKRSRLIGALIIICLWCVSKSKLSEITHVFKKATYSQEFSRYITDGLCLMPNEEGVKLLKSLLPKLSEEEINHIINLLATARHALGNPDLTHLARLVEKGLLDKELVQTLLLLYARSLELPVRQQE
ncbi:MAG: hypothetical protein GXO26_04760 [Crenarchaeota archaeon]|nr:hypothetical protein [Thermoproteota archaeon]